MAASVPSVALAGLSQVLPPVRRYKCQLAPFCARRSSSYVRHHHLLSATKLRGRHIAAPLRHPEDLTRDEPVRAGPKKGFAGGASRREPDLKDWTEVAAPGELQAGKSKAVIVKGTGYLLVSLGGAVYALQANCPACQFPMIKGKTQEDTSGGGAQIECPLCHSKFALSDGSVVEWCPKDGPVTFIIGTLKQRAAATGASVFPAYMKSDGTAFIKLKQPSTVEIS